MATVRLHLDDQELWSNLWGSGFESDPVNHNWLMRVEFNEGTDWNKWNIDSTATLWYIPEGEDETDPKFWGDDYQQHCATRILYVDDIANALATAMTEGYHHVPCGGRIDVDFDNWDCCVGDILLQILAYGKEVWA